MAPKRAFPDDPPTVSSSEEEEEEEERSSEEEVEEEEDEPEIAKPSSSLLPTAFLKKPFSKNPRPDTNSASLESGSESASGSDSEHARSTGVADPKFKLIAPARSKAKSPGDSNANRQVNDSKRAKKKQADFSADGGFPVTEDDGKKPVDDSKKLFQRLWSEDDEISILGGMVAYSAKKGTDPSKDMNAFHDFIRESLHVDVSKAQLMDKIRRLKKKYENNAGKGKNGEDPNFTKLHEKKAFELSKKIWVTEGVKQVKSNGKPGNNSRTVASVKAELDSKEAGKMDINQSSTSMSSLSEMIRFDKSLGLSGFGEDIAKRGLELIGESKRAELEERWKNLQFAELELYAKRAELINDQAKLIWEAYKSSNH